jgi:hypothetical protein
MGEIELLLEFLHVPLGDPEPVFSRFAELPGAIHRGKHPSQFLYVPGRRSNRVLLVAHADTTWTRAAEGWDAEIDTAVTLDLCRNDERIWNANGGLGADDRAGCAMLWLLRDLGHSLLITDGEERGILGSRWLMAKNPDIADEINQGHQFVVQLDRCNARDFKCYNVGTEAFRAYLINTTGYSEPDRTASTDITALCRDICGVNLSIGFCHEHTDYEYLDLAHWQSTLNLCRTWLAPPTLPRFLRRETPHPV